MTQKIQILDHHEAIKIAAGEVIERPANIIKELLENSIDAGAKNISLYLHNAGKTMIKIVDDGCGMSPEDALLCFAHHATSKIRSVQDLTTIDTYGFRGEALSSIAAISRVELITKTQNEKIATKIIFQNSKCIKQESSIHQTGTTFIITDLFENIPARKKFLKSDDTEWNQIVTIFQAFCLRYLDINFKLFHNDHLSYNCNKTNNTQTRAAQLWNNNLHEQLIIISCRTIKQITLHGAISTPQYYRFNRGQIFIFVNNRWIKNNELIKGILEGYQGVLPHQKYPAAFLNIEINPELIDINIHPKKEEVKFLNPGIAQQTVANCINETLNNFISQKISHRAVADIATDKVLEKKILVPISTEQRPLNKTTPFHPLTNIFKTHASSEFVTHKTEERSSKSIDHQPIFAKPIQQIDTNTTILTETAFTIIGQFNKTYIMLEQNNELILIDQHAAHERIMYQRLKIQGETPSVQLMFPHVIKMPITNVTKILNFTHLLSEHGIIIDQLSDCEIIITATPIGMQAVSIQEIIMMIVDTLDEEQDLQKLQLNEKIILAKACKTACKAGDTLEMTQMQNLIKELMKTPDKFSCPHGRPTMYPMTLKEIEKHFKRDYVGNKIKNISLE
ncbi:DNA mismatch repair endonuclease MutL [Candidatus Dependentiae bacterium]|nr:DNA mismatch repair endonuclease MutL [Candidatus Dependentiae bacterium]